MPGKTPVTTPPEVTVAIDGVLDNHTPPVVASVNAVVPPTHTLGVPAIATGDELTVTTAEVAQPLPSE